MSSNNCFLLVIIFVVILSSCATSKNITFVKLNDIDSVIRIVNPDHNCGCNWGNKTYKLNTGGSFSKNNFIWQSIYVKNIHSVDILIDSKKIQDELVKFEPAFSGYNRFFLEYRILDSKQVDTLKKYRVIGTWFNFKTTCSGFQKDISAEKLVKKTSLQSFRKSLCKN